MGLPTARVPGWPPASDAALAAGLVVLAVIDAITGAGPVRTAVAVAVTGALMAVPLAWRRRAPLVALAVVVVAIAVRTLTAAAEGPLHEVFVLLVAGYSVGRYRPLRRGVPGMIAVILLLAVSLWRDPSRHDPGDWLFAAVLVSGCWGFGVALREWRLRARRLAEEASRLAMERDRAAVDATRAERARIARELHDIVAHSVTAIVLNAGLVRRRITGTHPDESILLAEAEQTGRVALAELRRLLGLLRGEDDESVLMPYPGIAQLPELLERWHATGLAVALRVEGHAPALPLGLELTIYRIVQEALTNSARHNRDASAEVEIRYTDEAVSISVVDSGADLTGMPADEPGHGLIGMRERVAMYGGRIRYGPLAAGGFEVHACLPTGEVGE